MARKVIIDCDVGVDDALALILAFHSPEIEVQAVTGVNGNVPQPLVFRNIQKVLSLIQPLRRPWIAQGADSPLTGKGVYAHEVHGGDGLGGAIIPDSGREECWRSFPRPAHQLICELAAGEPGVLTLIAIGPLTNVALALDYDSKAMKAIQEIIIMGGAVRTAGNITPLAEFNIFVDPLAASKVFGSGLPIRLVPLDVTRQVALTPAIMEKRIGPAKNQFARFVIESTGYSGGSEKFFGGKGFFYLHDPLAVGAAIYPDLVGMEKVDLRVVTEGDEHYGQTQESRKHKSDKERICVGFKVDAEKFLDLFISRLKG